MINKKQAIKIGDKLNIDFDIIDIDEWIFGLNVELEHGKKFGLLTNITNNNLELTSKIALAHLLEYPDYYKRLAKMEYQAHKYWKNKSKNIFK